MRALAEDENNEGRTIIYESGARSGVYGLLVKCFAMSLFERLVALMVLDFGRVINVTWPFAAILIYQ